MRPCACGKASFNMDIRHAGTRSSRRKVIDLGESTMAENAVANTNDERAMRRAKRQALIDAGVDPYPIASTVNAFVADLAADYADLEPGGLGPEDEVHYLAGRIRGKRGHGKLMFLDLQDRAGQIQLFCRVNNLSEQAWEMAGQLDVGHRGRVERPEKGQYALHFYPSSFGKGWSTTGMRRLCRLACSFLRIFSSVSGSPQVPSRI